MRFHRILRLLRGSILSYLKKEKTLKTVRAIKSKLIQFHAKEGFELHESFPLLSSDPTLLFTNATITPFKDRHLGIDKPGNYALIQRCLRTGGATDLEKIGTNKQCFTFFEMFGAGIFGSSCAKAVSHLTRMMGRLGIADDRVYFVIPTTGNFLQALTDCGVSDDKIFFLGSNQVYWVDWRFGSGGPIGKGITVVYSQTGNRPNSVAEMESSSDDYIELLNLIQVFAVEKGGETLSCPVPTFDLGVGIERLAAVVQGCSPYEIDTIAPIVEMVRRFLPKAGESKHRMFADHLRACAMLILEGCCPSNKKGGYVLRKLLRRCIEASLLELRQWSGNTMLAMMVDTISLLEKTNQFHFSHNETAITVGKELSLFRSAARNSVRALGKSSAMTDEQFHSTYGSSRLTTAFFAQIKL